uniref:(northern house mosquito) hypothetical protein n=1 Tax=Culex pipiens TaxID=7175 RepID=A0A8D8BAC2_CULPI
MQQRHWKGQPRQAAAFSCSQIARGGKHENRSRSDRCSFQPVRIHGMARRTSPLVLFPISHRLKMASDLDHTKSHPMLVLRGRCCTPWTNEATHSSNRSNHQSIKRSFYF